MEPRQQSRHSPLALAERLFISPPLCCGLIAMHIGVVLLLDRDASAGGQALLGLATWAVLALGCRSVDRTEQARIVAVVIVATCGEIIGSIVWGLYTYRLDNLPLFVPPGHGLIYLCGLRMATSRFVRAHRQAVIRAALAVGAAWAIAGLTVTGRTDVLGALAMAALGWFLIRGRAPTVFAGVFLAVGLLELYGTAVGAWRWAPEVPGLGMPAGNPPSGIASGYCLFDALAIAIGPALLRLAGSPSRWLIRRRVAAACET